MPLVNSRKLKVQWIKRFSEMNFNTLIFFNYLFKNRITKHHCSLSLCKGAISQISLFNCQLMVKSFGRKSTIEFKIRNPRDSFNMVVNILNFCIHVNLYCDHSSINKTNSKNSRRFVLINLNQEILWCSFLLWEFCDRLWIPTQRSSCSWKSHVRGRWRWGESLFGSVVQTYWKASFWVFLLKQGRNSTIIQLLQELFVLWIWVIVKLSIIDFESIGIKSNFGNISSFFLLIFGVLIIRSGLEHWYLVFFSAFLSKLSTSGLITAMPLLSPPV